MECPDDNSLAEFMNGLLSGERRREIERHLDTCASCTQVLVGVGKSLDAGTRVGRYEITECLGRGAMGAVYAATDTLLDRSVALKVLHASLTESPGARERSLAEARALARLSHPNVVAIHDVGEHEGCLFIAMERLHGVTLTQWLAADTRSWRDVVDVFLQAAAGLAAAHQAGLVHRDFKPDNVFVTDSGRVCVTDLGLAHVEGRTPDTERGSLIGTPAYKSPEQLEARPATALSDQFSFCVALHEALYGQRPFRAPTPKELLAQMHQQPPSEPKPSATPAWIFPVLARGLAIEPAGRYESMQALERAVRRRLRPNELPFYLNAIFQFLLFFFHAGLTTLFVWAIVSKDTPEADTATDPDLVALHHYAAYFVGWLAVLFFSGWGPVGVVWTPLNTYGLLRKRPWAITSTLVYSGFAALTCLATPLAVVSLVTLWPLRKKTATSPESIRP